jgi:deoxyadenosine/deoxycytidine kinase
MAESIEFIGPRGAGKSTLYNAVLKDLPTYSSCAGDSFFFPHVDMRNKGIFGKIEYYIRKAFKKPLKDQRALQEFGYEFIQANQDLCQYAWNMIDKYQHTDCNFTDNRFRAAFNLYNNFRKQSLVEASNIGKYCLSGEGIVHASLLIFNKNYNPSDLAAFIELLPLPRAVIFCKASPEILAERCLKRRKVVTQIHKSKEQLLEDAEVETMLYRQILHELKIRGVEILRVDTSLSIQENKTFILEYLNKIEAPSLDDFQIDQFNFSSEQRVPTA